MFTLTLAFRLIRFTILGHIQRTNNVGMFYGYLLKWLYFNSPTKTYLRKYIYVTRVFIM